MAAMSRTTEYATAEAIVEARGTVWLFARWPMMRAIHGTVRSAWREGGDESDRAVPEDRVIVNHDVQQNMTSVNVAA